MMFFEECRVCKCPNCHSIAFQFITDIRRSKAVTNTSKLCCTCAEGLLHSGNPFGNCLIGECGMLPLPGLIIEVWILCMAVFPVLPNRVLGQTVNSVFIHVVHRGL